MTPDPSQHASTKVMPSDAAAAASQAAETEPVASLGPLLVDQGMSAAARLQVELSHLLTVAHELETFEQALFALARWAAVLDGVALVRFVESFLPARTASTPAAGKRVLRRLHIAAAMECDQAGYSRVAATHLLRSAWLEPVILCRRRSIGILSRAFIRNNSRNRLLREEVVRIFRLLNARHVHACVFGSLAISLNAGKFVKHHGDIDLVFEEEADTEHAARLLVQEMKYRRLGRHDWIGLTAERCFHIVLRSPRGVPIELSYLPENPRLKERVLAVDGVPVRAAELRALREIYALFLIAKAATSNDVELQSKKNAILTIDRLLAREVRGRNEGGSP